MAEELIDSYIDRAGVKGDTDYMVKSLQEVYAEFKKLESVKIDLKGAAGLAQSIPAMQQAKAGMDSLATATQTVEQRIAQMNGKSKEFTDVLLKQTKAQKEAAQAALLEAKAASEAAKAKATEAKATEQSAKAKAAEKKLIDQATNDYLQLSKAYNEASLKAKNYFVTLGESNPVTQRAIKEANDLGNVLKKADSAVGQFQRNVGNYKSAFDGLGFSFAQVGRELPSLAINVQTFALAISNNLPMVADELRKASEEIRRLKSEGKETPSLFSRIGKALLSFQTVLSVGITLLTVYAGKIFGATDNTKAMKEATDRLKESFDREKESIQGVIDVLQDYTEIDLANLEARGANEKQLNDRRILGAEQTLKQLQYLEASALQKKQEAERKAEVFNSLGRGKLVSGATKKQKEIFEAEAKAADAEFRRRRAETEKQERAIVKLKADIRKEDANRARQDGEDAASKAKELAERNAKATFDIEKTKLQQIIDFNNSIAENEQESLEKRQAALQYALEAELELIRKTADFEKSSGEKTSQEIKAIEADKFDKILRTRLEYIDKSKDIDKEVAEAQKEAAEKLTKAFEKTLKDRLDANLKYLEDLKKANQKAAEDQLKADKDFADKKRELTEDLVEDLTTLTFTIFTSGLEREKNAIQEQINLLEEKKRKDIEVANQTLTNTQERAAAIAVIEARAQAEREKLQRKQRDLDIKKAQFDKAASIARIVQETAQNIVKYFGTPLAILAGAIGAVQLATVIAQPIPRYKHGKNVNDLYEGPAIVGDGGRPEAIVREGGQVEITPDRPTLTYVKSRDIVLPDARMLSDLVVSGKLGGKLVEKPVVIENTGVQDAIKQMESSVVKAIKKIPQPVIKAEGIISRRIIHGDNSNTYLNDNLQF